MQQKFIWKSRRLSRAEKVVLLALAHLEPTSTTPSQTEIAQATGFTRRWVGEIIARLVTRGVLVTRTSGRRLDYTINQAELAALSAGEK